jgi:hypothetical protein
MTITSGEDASPILGMGHGWQQPGPKAYPGGAAAASNHASTSSCPPWPRSRPAEPSWTQPTPDRIAPAKRWSRDCGVADSAGQHAWANEPGPGGPATPARGRRSSALSREDDLPPGTGAGRPPRRPSSQPQGNREPPPTRSAPEGHRPRNHDETAGPNWPALRCSSAGQRPVRFAVSGSPQNRRLSAGEATGC